MPEISDKHLLNLDTGNLAKLLTNDIKSENKQFVIPKVGVISKDNKLTVDLAKNDLRATYIFLSFDPDYIRKQLDENYKALREAYDKFE